jgi:hypothetical protein
MRHRIFSPVTCAGQDERDIILAIPGCWKYLDPHHVMRKRGHENRERTFVLQRHGIEVIYFI